MLIDAGQPGAMHPDAPPISIVARPLGVRTNNVAEYAAVVLALRIPEARQILALLQRRAS